MLGFLTLGMTFAQLVIAGFNALFYIYALLALVLRDLLSLARLSSLLTRVEIRAATLRGRDQRPLLNGLFRFHHRLLLSLLDLFLLRRCKLVKWHGSECNIGVDLWPKLFPRLLAVPVGYFRLCKYRDIITGQVPKINLPLLAFTVVVVLIFG